VGMKFWVSVDGLMPQLDYLQVLLILKESEKVEAKKVLFAFSLPSNAGNIFMY
jgi:hypothetical protein